MTKCMLIDSKNDRNFPSSTIIVYFLCFFAGKKIQEENNIILLGIKVRRRIKWIKIKLKY